MVLSVHCCEKHVALNNVSMKNITVETQQWVVFLLSFYVSLSTIWKSSVCMRSPRQFCRILKASNVKFPFSPAGIDRFDTCGRRDGEIWRIQWTLFATCTISSENLRHSVLGLIQSGLFPFHGCWSVNLSVFRPTFLQPDGMYLYTESGIRVWFIRNK